MSFCPDCGGQVPDGSEFCANCGLKQPSAAPQASPGYQQPPPDYQQPPPDYQPPPPDYQQPPPGYQQPPPGYQQPPPGYQQPPPGYQQPPLGYQQPPPGYQQPPPGYQYSQPQGFIGEVYSKSLKLLFAKPIRLWALSLLNGLLVFLAIMLTVLVPIVWVAIVLVLELGMASIFLNGYRGKEITATQLFDGFNNRFFRNVAGMGWRYLWIFIWALIPIVGFIFAIIKGYAYRFVPYIMLNEPDIHATEALKKSMAQTDGYKGKMFLADFLIFVCVIVLSIIFYFIAMIPIIGFVLAGIYSIILVALLPLLMGILSVAYYEKIMTDNPGRM